MLADVNREVKVNHSLRVVLGMLAIVSIAVLSGDGACAVLDVRAFDLDDVRRRTLGLREQETVKRLACEYGQLWPRRA